jgi:predicted small metal-binding protein
MKTLRCACGWEVTGTEDEVVQATQDHAEKLHNMRATREEVLAKVESAES